MNHLERHTRRRRGESAAHEHKIKAVGFWSKKSPALNLTSLGLLPTKQKEEATGSRQVGPEEWLVGVGANLSRLGTLPVVRVGELCQVEVR